nr:MAG TPA: hypothetical protein [Caudoviricetes sp.]
MVLASQNFYVYKIRSFNHVKDQILKTAKVFTMAYEYLHMLISLVRL